MSVLGYALEISPAAKRGSPEGDFAGVFASKAATVDEKFHFASTVWRAASFSMPKLQVLLETADDLALKCRGC